MSIPAAGAVAIASAAAKAVTDVASSIINRRAVQDREKLIRQQLAKVVVQEVKAAELRESNRAIQLAEATAAANAVAGAAGVTTASLESLVQTNELMSQLDRAQDDLALEGVFDRFAVGMVQSLQAEKQAKVQMGINIASSLFGASAQISETSATLGSRVQG
ncbi:MAG: hypothetical protein D6816_17030 [Bacteroidetes bacterium]|nr:MAG: hypothetical protein D6816_17030 [Bacteroidota bacterium]